MAKVICSWNLIESTELSERFADPGDTIYSLMADEVLVKCPRCAGSASHRPVNSELAKQDWFDPRRLVCTHCGLTREWHEKCIYRCWRESPARDNYFLGRFSGYADRFAHEFWAYNWPHLAMIEKYVAAKLRLHARDPEYGWANKSFMNRLTAWIIIAKSRNDILATIDRIRRERQCGKCKSIASKWRIGRFDFNIG